MRPYDLALLLLVLLVYGQTLTFLFVNLHDPEYVTRNQPVLEGLSPALTARLSNAVVSYAINLRQTFWPMNPSVFSPLPPGGAVLPGSRSSDDRRRAARELGRSKLNQTPQGISVIARVLADRAGA